MAADLYMVLVPESEKHVLKGLWSKDDMERARAMGMAFAMATKLWICEIPWVFTIGEDRLDKNAAQKLVALTKHGPVPLTPKIKDLVNAISEKRTSASISDPNVVSFCRQHAGENVLFVEL